MSRGLIMAALCVSLCVFLLVSRTSAESLKAGQDAPNFSLRSLSSEEKRVFLHDFRGKLVVLNLWATWCATCMKEMAAFERLYQMFREQGLEIVAVAVDPEENIEKVRAVVHEQGLTFPVLLDPEAGTAERYGVSGFPETFFIDAEGKLLPWQDPLGSKPTLRVLADRPWDAPLYSKTIAGLLKRHGIPKVANPSK